jgi:Ca2+-binding RTX toxin-like protein
MVAGSERCLVWSAARCTRSGDYTANCSASGITLVSVNAGDLVDRVTNSTPLRSSLSGASGADVLTGGSGRDTITGGSGADTMKDMNGNDRVLGRDATDDTVVNCDGGSTPGTADSADLDALPKDSPATGCESVTRH